MSHEAAPQGHEAKHNKPTKQEVSHHNERLREHHESAAEKSPDTHSAEREARHEIAQEALPTAEYDPSDSEGAGQHQDVPVPSRQEKTRSFNTTMHHVRKDLSPTERTLSKVMHQPVVERVSEVAGKTVSRPSGIIGATLGALIGLTFVFGIAKYSGFELSGSEMPLLLVGGFALGLFLEWAYKSVRSLLPTRK